MLNLLHSGVKFLRLETWLIVIFGNLKKQELCTAISFFLIRERRGKDLYDGSKIPNYSWQTPREDVPNH
jgi:hypothetical protein